MENTNFTTPESAREPLLHPKEETSPAFHFFLYLVSFLSLAFVAIGVGTIVFQIINKYFPDSFNNYSGVFSDDGIKFGLSALIIASPVYFSLSYIITKYLREGKISENSKIRKWLTYIILFIAAAVIIGDLIALVNGVLGGEALAKFVLKIFTVLVIAGSIFGYYLWDVRRRGVEGKTYSVNKIIMSAALAVIVAVFVSSLFIIESPTEARNLKIDNQTVDTLRNYQYSIDSYYARNKKLPVKLEDLSQEFFGPFSSDAKITYEITGDTAYKLCADFKRSTENSSSVRNFQGNEWKHEKGNQCFTREVNQTPPPLPMK